MLPEPAYLHPNLPDTIQSCKSTSKPPRCSPTLYINIQTSQMLSNPVYQHPNLTDALQPCISTSKLHRCSPTLYINIQTSQMLSNPAYQHPNLTDALQPRIPTFKPHWCPPTLHINIQTSQMFPNPAYKHPNRWCFPLYCWFVGLVAALHHYPYLILEKVDKTKSNGKIFIRFFVTYVSCRLDTCM